MSTRLCYPTRLIDEVLPQGRRTPEAWLAFLHETPESKRFRAPGRERRAAMSDVIAAYLVFTLLGLDLATLPRGGPFVRIRAWTSALRGEVDQGRGLCTNCNLASIFASKDTNEFNFGRLIVENAQFRARGIFRRITPESLHLWWFAAILPPFNDRPSRQPSILSDSTDFVGLISDSSKLSCDPKDWVDLIPRPSKPANLVNEERPAIPVNHPAPVYRMVVIGPDLDGRQFIAHCERGLPSQFAKLPIDWHQRDSSCEGGYPSTHSSEPIPDPFFLKQVQKGMKGRGLVPKIDQQAKRTCDPQHRNTIPVHTTVLNQPRLKLTAKLHLPQWVTITSVERLCKADLVGHEHPGNRRHSARRKSPSGAKKSPSSSTRTARA